MQRSRDTMSGFANFGHVCSLWMILLVLFPAVTDAQLADTLHEVQIHNKRKVAEDARLNDFSPGQKIVSFDSAALEQYRMQQLSALLAQQTPVFIKSYGLGGLATLNLRGSSAAQSLVLWNGIPIQNASLGMADVSMLPLSFVHKVHVVYGSSAALWGSGNVGGAVVLESEKADFGKGTRGDVSVAIGSFGQQHAGGSLSWSGKKLSFTTNLLWQTAENDFRYMDARQRKRRMDNARLNGMAALAQAAYKAGDDDMVRVALWTQQYKREIPPALFEEYSGKLREDWSWKVMADWERKLRNGGLYTRAAVIRDFMRFDDDTIELHNRNQSNQYYLEPGWRWQSSSRHRLLLFAPMQLLHIERDTDTRQQTRVALAGSYAYTNKRLDLALSLRGEQVDRQGVLLPGLSASYRISRIWKLKANIQKTYRAPSLNELYYQPGGNTDLKPEQGWSQDLGYTLDQEVRGLVVKHELTAFNRRIQNWIIWLGGAIWTPHNIAAVQSRGLETENSLVWSWRRWRFHFGLNAAYVRATTVESYIVGDGARGKQIPYTPEYNGQVNAGFYFRSLYVNLNHNVTGYRYFNMDETGLLPKYQTSNFQCSYPWVVSGHTLLFTFQVNNMFDTRYEVMKSRPMPGPNWLAGLKWTPAKK